MSVIADLFKIQTQQTKVGTVLEELGGNKYRVRVGDSTIVAYTTLASIKKGIPAVVTRTSKGWYIMGQPKNLQATGSIEVVLPG